MSRSFDSYGRDKIQSLIYESTSIREVLIKLGLRGEGGNHKDFHTYLEENGYDTSTLVGRSIKKHSNAGIPKKRLSEILCENGSGNSSKLKDRLIREGVKKYECEKCHNTTWNGQPISLELHHINGNHYDNRLENLIILCPNCHAQTSNYRGKHTQYDIELSKIAQEHSCEKLNELKQREKLRAEEIYLNHLRNGDISKGIRKPREKRYCEQCGNEIIGKGKRFCSTKCCEEYNRQNKYDKDKLLEDCKRVTSMIQLGKLYNITDNAIKKQLKRLEIFEEVKKIIKENKRK